MISKIISTLFLAVPIISFSQTSEEDEVRFKAAVDWLDSKLNYIYHDNSSNKWWNNTFYINDKKEVTIKHIASNRVNTANIKDKTYTIRTFQIQEINPKSLKIVDIEESRGRLVKGQMLELRTFSFKEAIHKSINNRRASSTSFLFLSFPETLIDTVSNYAEIVKQKFEEAILASTQLYASHDQSDIKTTMNALTGNFQSDDGKTWITENVQSNVLSLKRENGMIEYFGYDPNDEKFYLISLSDQGAKKQLFELDDGPKLNLSTQEGSEKIYIKTNNSFSIGGKDYFRQ